MTFVAILAAMLVRFRAIVGPLIMAFVLSYLLFRWQLIFVRLANCPSASVNLICLVVVIIFGDSRRSRHQHCRADPEPFRFRPPVDDRSACGWPICQQCIRDWALQFSLQQYDLQALTNQVLSVVNQSWDAWAGW
jgi:hypothetical protein